MQQCGLSKNVVCYHITNTAVFAGVETGEYKKEGTVIPLRVRATCFFAFINEKQRWLQLHHHVSIDNVTLLQQYQEAIKK